jgi:hypothetical protein
MEGSIQGAGIRDQGTTSQEVGNSATAWPVGFIMGSREREIRLALFRSLISDP